MNKFSSRKLIIALVSLAITITMRVMNFIDGGQFVTLFSIIFGFYVAGNVGAKVAHHNGYDGEI